MGGKIGRMGVKIEVITLRVVSQEGTVVLYHKHLE